MRRNWLLTAALVSLTVAAFWGVWQFEFVYFDDPGYITENVHVRGGLTWSNVAWAFTTREQANWHPLTWLSHCLDVSLYGHDAVGQVRSGGHHLTSLLLHALNAVLLWRLLHAMTGAAWRSALVAALFAVHPLHVESVAWVSERKDVLSTLLGLCTLRAYLWHTRRPSWIRSAVVATLFALGLMAKPMLVTLPCLMLLLDYWPLDRWRGAAPPDTSFRRLIAEKIPLFVLSAVSSITTYRVQLAGGGVIDERLIPWSSRLPNAVTAYATYLVETFWPVGLAAYYPYREPNALAAAAALVALMAATAAVIWAARRGRRHYAVGWFWYLIALAPVIGLIKVGSQSVADRYTYLPVVGLFIMVAWGLGDVAQRWPRLRFALALAAVGAVLLCAALTHRQSRCWRNSESLHGRTLAVTENNAVTCNDLANVLAQQKRYAEAMSYYAEALRIEPRYADAHNNLANVLNEQGRRKEAEEHYRYALALKPNYVVAHVNLANLLADAQRPVEAVACYRQALAIDPQNIKALCRLTLTLIQLDRYGEAIESCRKAADLAPQAWDVQNLLALLLATAAPPGDAAAEAVARAQRLAAATGRRHPAALNTLAAAYASAGRFREALAVADEALALAEAGQLTELAAEIRARRALYAAGKPYRVVGGENARIH